MEQIKIYTLANEAMEYGDTWEVGNPHRYCRKGNSLRYYNGRTSVKFSNITTIIS